MPPVQVLLVCAAAGALWFGGRAVVHGVKRASHSVCHVVTLGAKCKPAPKAEPELPYNSVDCDNANGDPKKCTVEADEPK